MFGEKCIIGLEEKSIDDKGRVNIARLTGAEVGEVLALQYVQKAEQESFIRLYAKSLVEKYSQILRDKMYDASHIEERHAIRKELDEFCSSFNYYVEVDSQKRILIPKPIVKSANFESKVTLQGCGDSLIIRK